MLDTSFDPGMLRIANENNAIGFNGPKDFGGGIEENILNIDNSNQDRISLGDRGDRNSVFSDDSSDSDDNLITNLSKADRKRIKKAHKKGKNFSGGFEENILNIDNSDEDRNSVLSDDSSDSGDNLITNLSKADRKRIKEAHKKEKEINKEKDPLKIIEKVPDKAMDELLDELQEENRDYDLDLITEAPRWKKGNKAKGGKEADNQNDLKQASDDLEPAADFQFTALKLPDRKRSGTRENILSGLAYYSGQTIGRVFGAVGNIFYWLLLHLPYKAYKAIKGEKAKPRISPDKFQKVRKHDAIPGWNGKKFQEQVRGERMADDPIDVDFRKIPGVWSQLTAGKAADENGRPLDPVITIYVAEPKEKSDAVVSNRDIGHTFIGLEFSHFSKVTNRFERYTTKFGLFAPGANNISSYVAGFYKNATIPAQLLNDKNYQYDISRSYPAKPWQVNDIMKASETYPDLGYRLFDRNCTTFVKEMVVNIAHIKDAEHILQSEIIRMDHAMNGAMFSSIMVSPNATLGMRHDLADDFDNAHNYMLDKQGYRQQDIDYAFELGKKEKGEGVGGDLIRQHRTASDTYKAVFLEKIFGGLRERAGRDPEQGGMDRNTARNTVPMSNWLNQDMSTAAERKLSGMKMIIKGLAHSMDNPDHEKMYRAVKDLFVESWFPLALPPRSGDEILNTAGNIAPGAFAYLMSDRSKKFPKIVMSVINAVLEHDQEDSLTKLKKESGKKKKKG